jgi:hypothetical protein
MNQFTAFGTDAVTAEVEYRRAVLTVSSPRRVRRARKATR